MRRLADRELARVDAARRDQGELRLDVADVDRIERRGRLAAIARAQQTAHLAGKIVDLGALRHSRA